VGDIAPLGALRLYSGAVENKWVLSAQKATILSLVFFSTITFYNSFILVSDFSFGMATVAIFLLMTPISRSKYRTIIGKILIFLRLEVSVMMEMKLVVFKSSSNPLFMRGAITFETIAASFVLARVNFESYNVLISPAEQSDERKKILCLAAWYAKAASFPADHHYLQLLI